MQEQSLLGEMKECDPDSTGRCIFLLPLDQLIVHPDFRDALSVLKLFLLEQ
jgi:hypothetical protein